jgi:hypothetical protein
VVHGSIPLQVQSMPRSKADKGSGNTGGEDDTDATVEGGMGAASEVVGEVTKEDLSQWLATVLPTITSIPRS